MKKILILLICFFVVQIAYAYDDEYYSGLYEKATQSIEQGNEENADFYLARYMGASFMDEETDKSLTDLYPLFTSYKVSKPNAFISGRYSPDFIEWFIFSSISQWGRDDDADINAKTHSFGIISCENDKYIASIIGSPYLEGWTVLKDKDYKTAILTLIHYKQKPYITVIEHEKGVPKKVFENIYFDLGTNNIQYIWLPEFHDLDGDGKDELWVRYNKAWADGFSQELAIYAIEENNLKLIKKFEGLAEGIARRLDDNTIEVGYGFSDKETTGHMGYEQHHIEQWQYKDGDFIKISEKNVPHILWSDAWLDYYSTKKK
ncbi:MAG: hypothetical protein ABIG64_03605 [Candidatus Omnitrophota bacterium]